jgi:hypothetical protein
MDKPKIPPAKVDAMAERLQTSLKRRRPRGWLVIVGLIVAIGLILLLAWWFYAPVEMPRLEVVAFDAVVAPGETPRAAAQLAFPEEGKYDPSLLLGHEIVFLDPKAAMLTGAKGTPVKVGDDALGRAATDWTRPAPGQSALFAVRYADVRNKQTSDDQASLFAWERGGKLLLVDVEEALAQIEPAQWETAPFAAIAARPQAAQALQEAVRKQHQVGYLALTPTTALAYRKVRGWVHTPRPEAERFPAGPVLGRPEYPSTGGTDLTRNAQLGDLKQRFGDHITLVVRTANAATAGTAHGLRVIVLDPAVELPGVRSVAGWTEVIPQLEKE